MPNPSIGTLLQIGWRIYQIDIPDEPDRIDTVSEGELALAAFKMNALGFNPDKREKYEALYDRAVQIWGEYPESLIGWYTTRTFWWAIEAPSITGAELLHDRKGLKEQHVEYWEKLSERRREKLVSKCDRFDDPAEVPEGLSDYLIAFVETNWDDDEEVIDHLTAFVENKRDEREATPTRTSSR